MKRFFDKAKAVFDDLDGPSDSHAPPQASPQQAVVDQPQNSAIRAPSPADVIRYRYHHGTNVGSVFIMEKWLTSSMYPDSAEGSAERAAVKASVKEMGMDGARQKFEHFWATYLSDSDIDWLKDVAKCTTIRLPIGYFTLGPAYCQGTPFEKYSQVYSNAWAAVMNVVSRCHNRGIGTLIDLHGLPGGANAQEHSGTNSGKAELWGSRKNLDLATRCVCFIIHQTRSIEGVAGVQIINEAEHHAEGMYEWYDRVIAEASSIDPTMPIYVSDAWDLGTAASWSQRHNSLHAGYCSPVVIDTHYYWAFTGSDKEKTPQQITHEVHGKLHALDGKDGGVLDRGACQAVVGEYSCVLTEDSWAKRGDVPKEQLVRDFGNAQSQRYQSRAGGSFFWTYRMDWMEGGEWGFKQMTNQGAICPPFAYTLPVGEIQNRLQHAQSSMEQFKQATVGGHCHWWDTNHPGQYEHWRFEQGWGVGFSDAMAFFGMRAQQGRDGGDKIGMLDLWVLKRLRESAQGGRFVWEFEQGLRQGVRDFYKCVGV
ncbi:hypothetical protein MBLNU230_g0166t1 [Neophaeotheca triangularis]